ncbi:hypothetical protein ACLBSN_22115, partial [Klebsiella pneumoniae]
GLDKEMVQKITGLSADELDKPQIIQPIGYLLLSGSFCAESQYCPGSGECRMDLPGKVRKGEKLKRRPGGALGNV